MAQYKSKPATVNRSAEQLFERLSDLSRLQDALDQLPQEQRAQVGAVEFKHDSFKIQTPQVGDIAFKVIERQAPSRVVFGTESSPVPLTLALDIVAAGPESATVTASIEVEIPAMLRPLVGPQLQKAADQLGNLIGTLNS
ncbi:MAG: hypothetical protein K2O10_01120 [Muribaculaceae bacterium]|nr:hypothetical protein [Muribaculaceae bacterium]